MQQGVKISEVIDLIHKTEPIGTAEDRFARGGNEFDVERTKALGMGCLKVVGIVFVFIALIIMSLWLR